MGAPTTTEVASLFGALSPAFPGWQNPSPNAYTYTLPQQGWWQTLFGGGAIKDAVNWLADLALQLVAWGLHIGILVASRFSDPGWLLDPVAKRLGQVFRAGYGGVFLRILPFLLLATALYVVWQYIRARHEKILTAVVSTALTGALIFAFFFNFGWLFKTVNGLAQSLTDTLGDAVVSTVQTRPGSMYDALWDVYVLNTWEAGQFGHASSNIQDFDVSQEVLAKGETYTNDAGQTVALQPGDNWVKLLLQNRTDAARQSLLQDLTSVDHPFAQTSWTTADVEGASPYSNFVFDILTFLMMIPTLIFLGFMAFLLFSQSLMFLFLALLGIVTVPVAFIPEVGWMVTLRWMREAVGYLLLKMFNVVYMAVAFGLAELVTQSLAVSGGEDQLVLAMMADALIFLAALLFHAKVLHALRPYVEAVQGLGRRAEEAGEENHRVSDAATDARRDAVREASLSGRFRVSSQNARSAANDAVRAGASEPQRGVVGRLASAFSREAVVGAVKAKVADAMDSLRNPQRTTWQERAQRRADRVVALERRAHGAGIAAHAAAGRLAVKGGRAALRWAFETRTGSPASVDEAQETGQAAVPETGGPVQNDVESGGVERRADIPSPARQAAPDHPSDAEAGRARRRMEAPDGEGSARATRGTTQRAEREAGGEEETPPRMAEAFEAPSAAGAKRDAGATDRAAQHAALEEMRTEGVRDTGANAPSHAATAQRWAGFAVRTTVPQEPGETLTLAEVFEGGGEVAGQPRAHTRESADAPREDRPPHQLGEAFEHTGGARTNRGGDRQTSRETAPDGEGDVPQVQANEGRRDAQPESQRPQARSERPGATTSRVSDPPSNQGAGETRGAQRAGARSQASDNRPGRQRRRAVAGRVVSLRDRFDTRPSNPDSPGPRGRR